MLLQLVNIRKSGVANLVLYPATEHFKSCVRSNFESNTPYGAIQCGREMKIITHNWGTGRGGDVSFVKSVGSSGDLEGHQVTRLDEDVKIHSHPSASQG